MTELSLIRLGREGVEMLLDVDVDAKTFQEMEPDQDAYLIRRAMDVARQKGYLVSVPYPTVYEYTGDFKTDLARILLAEGYGLPDDWMAAAQLNKPEPEEEGVDN
jgi:hypothetical protein